MKHILTWAMLLVGCEVYDTPSLPELDRPSISYEKIMEWQKKLKQRSNKASKAAQRERNSSV